MEGVRLSATNKESYSTRKKNFKRVQHQHSRTKVQDLQETVKHLLTEVSALKSVPPTPAATVPLVPTAISTLATTSYQPAPGPSGTAAQGPDQFTTPQDMDLGDAKDWEDDPEGQQYSSEE